MLLSAADHDLIIFELMLIQRGINRPHFLLFFFFFTLNALSDIQNPGAPCPSRLLIKKYNVGFMPGMSVSSHHDRTTQLLQVDGESKSF